MSVREIVIHVYKLPVSFPTGQSCDIIMKVKKELLDWDRYWQKAAWNDALSHSDQIFLCTYMYFRSEPH